MATSRAVRVLLGVLLIGGLVAAGIAFVPPVRELTKLLFRSDTQTLRREPVVERPDARPKLLVLALDGVGRALLYPMLERGELPELAALLGGGQGGAFPHAYFDRATLSPLPSSTLASWATFFTGRPPGVHGVAGNEYFEPETRTFRAPAPVSLTDPTPVLATFSEGYANELLGAETIYERMHARDPRLVAWVSMSQFHRGADKLLLAERGVLGEAFTALLQHTVAGEDALRLYASLDGEVVDTLLDNIDAREVADVVTLYLTGADNYAHGAEEGPEPAIRRYLRDVIDPAVGKVRRKLEHKGELEGRYVLVVSDHGHTEVVRDEAHALATSSEGDPPEVLARAGFALRPFELEVDADEPFSAVLAYGGALAYVYLADRSTCPPDGQRGACDFARGPRFDEDVVPAAEAFFRASRDGEEVPAMRGTLDMVLVRRRGPGAATDVMFEVYLGDGRTEALSSYLERVPHRHYVEMVSRLRELAVGPRGAHAGDVLLVARNGDEEEASSRYYFAGLYRSWHGSPSRRDSEVSLVLAHPRRTVRQLAALVARHRSDPPTLADAAALLLEVVVPPPRSARTGARRGEGHSR